MAGIQANRTRWKNVVVPNEHGGWSFVGEPIVLGLLLAPTWGGLALAVAAVVSFLLRHPLRIRLKDGRVGRDTVRARLAERVVAVHAVVLLGAMLVAVSLAPSRTVLVPLLVAAPLIVVQLSYDAQGRSRDAVAEIAGVLAMGSLTSSMVMFDGWTLSLAAGPWLALAVKGVATVLYVRARLRTQRGEPASRGLAVGAHLIAVAILTVAVVLVLVPWTAAMMMVLLTLRAVVGLSPSAARVTAKAVGTWEAVYGLAFVLALVVGYRVD